MFRIHDEIRAPLIGLAVLVAGIAPLSGQQLLHQDLTFVGPSPLPAINLGPIPNFPSPATIGVAEVDVVNTPLAEWLFHDGTNITWLDVTNLASGVLAPAPPGPITDLLGMQLVGSPRRDLVVLSNGPAGSSLFALDLAVPASPWFGGPLGFTVSGMAGADVVGGPAEDLVLTDGTNLVAVDLINPTVFVPLPAPPTVPVDSIHTLNVGLGFPLTSAQVELAADAYGPAGAVTHTFDKTAGAWRPASLPRVRVASATAASLTGAAPVVGNLVLSQPNPVPIQLTDIAPAAGVFGATTAPGGDMHCPGAVLTDMNNDGNADIYLSRGLGAAGSAANQLFYGNGAGGFTQQTTLGALDGGNGSGAVVFDYDNDGLQDVLVINMNGDNQLYRQQPTTGAYVNVTASTDPTPTDPPGDLQEGIRVGVPDLAGGGHCPPNQPGDCLLNDTLAAAVGDVNRDGLPDIYFGNHLCCTFPEGERDVLMLQNPGGTFTDITFAAGLTTRTVRHDSTQAVIIADLNGDQWPDIYVAVKTDGPTRDKLYLNDGGSGGSWSGTFTEWFANQPDPQLGAVSAAAMGIDVADVDNDGDLDIFITDLDLSMDFYLNQVTPFGFNLQLVQPNPMASPFWSWGVHFADYDNDADVDLHMSTNPTIMDWFYENRGGGVWRDIAFDAGVGVVSDTRGNIPGDVDNDGRMDLLLVDKTAPIRLYRNQSTTTNNYLRVRLVGNPTLPPAPYRSGTDAIGAAVRVTAGGITQRRDVFAGGITCGSTRDRVLHFGLGTATNATQVIVQFPSGRTTTLTNVAANQLITVNE